MLTALAQRPQGLSGKQLGVRAGMSSGSGTFANYLSNARRAGWIDGARSLIRITESGISALGNYDPLPTGKGLLNHWIKELGDSGASKMLGVLAERYPATLTAQELGEVSGMSSGSGTFANYLSRLRTLELITGGRGNLRASDEFFEQ